MLAMSIEDVTGHFVVDMFPDRNHFRNEIDDRWKKSRSSEHLGVYQFLII